MDACLTLVTERFPQQGAEVACLFDTDPVFRELCEDYETCTHALARQPASSGLSDEYAALQLRLETELLRHLERELSRHGQPPATKGTK